MSIRHFGRIGQLVQTLLKRANGHRYRYVIMSKPFLRKENKLKITTASTFDPESNVRGKRRNEKEVLNSGQ